MDSVLVEGLQCVKWKPLEFKVLGVTQPEASEECSLLADNPV